MLSLSFHLVSPAHPLLSLARLSRCSSTRVTQDLDASPAYDARFWNPPSRHAFKNKRPVEAMKKLQQDGGIKIYEAHGELLLQV